MSLEGKSLKFLAKGIVNYFSYCWLHIYDFEIVISFTKCIFVHSSSLSFRDTFPVFLLSFISHFVLTWALDASVISIPGTCSVETRRFMPVFSPSSEKGSLLEFWKQYLLIQPHAFRGKTMMWNFFITWDIFLISVPLPTWAHLLKNPNAPPLKWNRTESSIFCLWWRLPPVALTLNGRCVSFLFLSRLTIGIQSCCDWDFEVTMWEQ